jgi:hypothetical protein
MENFHRIVDAVQTNCYINDARHAQDMTMCTYLLEMRQFYRWEHSLPYSQRLPKEELGQWLTERERLWQELESESYRPVPVPSGPRDPFEAEAINADLVPEGYVYGGGVGRFQRPHFFLARLERYEKRQGFTVLVAGCEYARDLIAPPAALLHRTIYVRREAVQDFLWSKLEEWNWKRQDNALGRALACYDFDGDPERALTQMTDAESEAMILHELGEGLAGELLGEERWQEVLASCSRHKPEIVARAVRDNLADCLTTLPTLIAEGRDSSVHFYFGNFTGMRAKLFPAAYHAYRAGVEAGHWRALRETVERGRAHWETVARRILELNRADPKTERRLAALAEEAVL